MSMNEPEDKIILKTKIIAGNMAVGSVLKRGILLENLLAAFGEVYMQANNIGWETKALDSLFEEVRKILD